MPSFRLTSFLSVVVALTVSACTTVSSPLVPPAPAVSAQKPADELYELSPARIHLQRLTPQAMRLLAPHWSRVRESDRKALQATLVQTLAEGRVAPFVKARLRKGVEAQPALAAAALEWLRSPLGYEVKFAEATAWSDDKSAEDTFSSRVTEARENRMPEVRSDRVRRLGEATSALDRTLDLTASVGTVVARLVNVARPSAKPLTMAALESAVTAERHEPRVVAAYTPVVTAALLARTGGLDLDELDRYIAFASSDAGRWYHATFARALVAAIGDASMDVEGLFDTNAHSDSPVPDVGGMDLDSLLVSLPSGREVRLLAMAQAGPATAPTMVLRYETSLALANAGAVRGEAREVWEKVRSQIESGGALAAVLQPTGSVDGWVFPFASSRRFAWRRTAAAADWSIVSDEPASFGAAKREMLWSIPP